MALPLAVLLASLIAYGNLGEHFELTAIKSSGISLLRTIQPIFIFVLLIAMGSFLFNNYVVPIANLKGYSLLYDIKQKKPALEFKEGLFYNGLPGFSIKVGKKYPDGISLSEVIIYDHTQSMGNTKLIMADSGKMYSVMNDRYLKLELFSGHFYNESGETQNRYDGRELTRTRFDESDILFSLASFDMNKTAEELFTHNRVMKNVSQLTVDVDSMRRTAKDLGGGIIKQAAPFYFYHFKPLKYKPEVPYFERFRSTSYMLTDYQESNVTPPRSLDYFQKIDFKRIAQKHIPENLSGESKTSILVKATNSARNVRGFIQGYKDRVSNLEKEANSFEIEKYRKFTQAVAIFVMFLIGAPLGAIIKKGGLGVPVLISIIFFIIFYVITLLSEKYAKEAIIDMELGMWAANLVLFPIGLFFLRQAKNDSPLFDLDFYLTTYQAWTKRLATKSNK